MQLLLLRDMKSLKKYEKIVSGSDFFFFLLLITFLFNILYKGSSYTKAHELKIIVFLTHSCIIRYNFSNVFKDNRNKILHYIYNFFIYVYYT
jgi:hypothetical protein